MTRTKATLGSIAFFFVGPLLEAVLGPFVITGGFQPGDGALDHPAAQAAGVVLIAAGALTIAACFTRFIRDGTGTPSPLAPPQQLVAQGPYRHVRNPMYVATAAVIAGEGLVIARPILLAAAAVYVLALGLLVRRFEEPLLRRRFGEAWDDYARHVPGWLPRRTPWRAG
jgi:protein-S-isoprenylcysteine O-methyltransferase Ste14